MRDLTESEKATILYGETQESDMGKMKELAMDIEEELGYESLNLKDTDVYEPIGGPYPTSDPFPMIEGPGEDPFPMIGPGEWKTVETECVDMIQHPPHYTSHPSGIECIQITEHMGFNTGNALKYVWRADLKHESPLADLKKAKWYIEREIALRSKGDE